MIPAAAWLLAGGMVLEYSFGGTAWSAEVSRASTASARSTRPTAPWLCSSR
ncbi:MAG: hypothetical protein ACRDP7_35015 [Trebonia sp.]